MSNHLPEIYFDQSTSRSPEAQRQLQMLHRQTSRPFDTYGGISNGDMFNPQDQTIRYDQNRFDRPNGAVAPGPYPSDPYQSQSWNPTAFNGNQFPAAYAATTRIRPQQMRGRQPLPNTWMEGPQIGGPMPYGAHASPSPLGVMGGHRGSESHDAEDELIPTAIVIKNIPFAVRKEQLVDLMTSLGLPLPYAFNYHFDNGVFRGLAFANFTSADETELVIQNMNGYEIQGRRLRVEYKKMLPLQERERIEREKRERRGQLEEQHRPIHTPSLHNHPSMSSITSHRPANTPSPIGIRPDMPDLNDRETLQFYNQLLIFKEDFQRESLIFPAMLSSQQRRIVHTLAHHMELHHQSEGVGEQRQLHIFRHKPSPPNSANNAIQAIDLSRRNLNRAATIEFNEARNPDTGNYSILRGQQSTGLLGIPDSPNGFGNHQNLRPAKSVADLRSLTPSPVPSSNSFSQNLINNASRYQEYASGSGSAGTPVLATPATGTFAHRGDDGLANGFSNMTIRGSHAPSGDSPRRLRSMFSWDHDKQANTNGPASAGAIGSNRSVSSNQNLDNAAARDRGIPLRQPHGPSDRSAAFSRARQNGGHQHRGSDELNHQSNVEIIVE